jgi:hypothetical protein
MPEAALLQLAVSLAGSSHVSAALLPARPSSRLLRVRAGRLALPGLLHTDAHAPAPSRPVKLVSQDAARLRLPLLLALLLLPPPPACPDPTGTGAAITSSTCA